MTEKFYAWNPRIEHVFELFRDTRIDFNNIGEKLFSNPQYKATKPRQVADYTRDVLSAHMSEAFADISYENERLCLSSLDDSLRHPRYGLVRDVADRISVCDSEIFESNYYHKLGEYDALLEVNGVPVIVQLLLSHDRQSFPNRFEHSRHAQLIEEVTGKTPAYVIVAPENTIRLRSLDAERYGEGKKSRAEDFVDTRGEILTLPYSKENLFDSTKRVCKKFSLPILREKISAKTYQKIYSSI